MDSYCITRFIDWSLSILSNTVDRVMDFQNNIVLHIADNTASTSNIGSDILAKLDDISTHGIGFSDVVGAISFPLIIALFAFSFPFIFQIINDINNKYDSKQLSKLFASSWQYVFFWICNVMSICYLLIYGMIDLLLPKEDFNTFTVVGDWVSISLASVYAMSVLCFVWRCVAFNNPNILISLVRKRYKYELRINKLRDIRLFIKYYVRCFVRSKGKASRSNAFKSAQKMVGYLSTNAPHEHYVNLLIEITHYAIRRKDKEVFNNVLLNLNKIIEEEKNQTSISERYNKSKNKIQESDPHNRTMRFFEDLATIYTPTSNDFLIEESIVSGLLGAFNKSMYMNFADSFKLSLCVSDWIDGNNITLLEKYIDNSRYYFTYIKRLPDVLYVKGGNASERLQTEDYAQRSWDELCDYHYLVFAYAFANGHYSLLNALLDKNSQKRFDLYPQQSTDILIRYAHCRTNLIHFPVDELFKRRVDVEDMLNKYTVALILLVGNSNDEYHKVTEHVTKETIADIESYCTDLQSEIGLIKQRSKLVEQFPQIKDTDFSSVYSTCMEYITAVINPVLPKEEAHLNAYQSPLDAHLINEFNARMQKIMKDVSKYVPMDLFGTDKEGKDRNIPLKKCLLPISKLDFTYPSFSANRNAVYNSFVELISARLSYITLTVFRNMDVKEVWKTPSDFNLFFENYTNGRSEDYIIINVDSRFSSLLDIEFRDRSRFYLGTVPFITLNCISWLSLMTDLPDYEYFKGSLLIVAKKDLPLLEDINGIENISVECSDASDEQAMKLDAKITADTGKNVMYNKNGKIVKVGFKKLG